MQNQLHKSTTLTFRIQKMRPISYLLKQIIIRCIPKLMLLSHLITTLQALSSKMEIHLFIKRVFLSSICPIW